MAASGPTTLFGWRVLWPGTGEPWSASSSSATALACAKKDQKVPTGYYNVETMLASVLKRGGRVGVYGTCMDARGISEQELVEGARRSTMDELTQWTVEADKALVF